MSIKRTFNGATIIKPGAYSKIVVENLTGFPLQPTGVVGIVGEAQGGEPHVLDILSKEGIQDAKARYKSGPIADALEILANPSNDQRIANGASTIVVYKTNNSTQSQLNLRNTRSPAVNQVLLKSKNYGADENLLNVTVAAGDIPDANAVIAGSLAGPFALSGAETLIVNAKNTVYTFTNTLTGSTTAAALIAELNTGARWAPAKPVIAAPVGATQRIQITIDPTVVTDAEKDYGYLKIDASSTLDTIVGITGENRGAKGSRIFTFKKNNEQEITAALGGTSRIQIKYVGAGTAAELTLSEVSGQLKLVTTVTGASGEDLDIVLRDSNGQVKHTVKTLAELIDSSAVYEATVLSPDVNLNADRLDYYSALDIRNVAAILKSDIDTIVSEINRLSSLVVASKIVNVYRELATFSLAQFFSGASDGSSSNSDFANGFTAFKDERINVVVPLISEDQGAITIDSVNALAKSHVIEMWSTTGRSERHAFVSKNTSKTGLVDAAKSLQSGFVSIVGQRSRVLDRKGDLVWLDPWASACLLAGMRAGAEVGEPLTSKLVNVNNMDVEDASWSPRKDFAELIEAGVTIFEPLDTGGFRCVLGNTTYGIDANFVFNRESVVQAAGFVAYDLRYNLDLVFTGTKARTGSAEAIANFIKARMSTYLESDIIVGDDLNEGLGYKNLRVSIQGNTAVINVSVTPVQGIDFLLPTIYLADIRQSA